MEQRNHMEQIHITSLLQTPDDQAVKPAATPHTDDESLRMAAALDRYVSWIDMRQVLCDDQAQGRRHRRQQKQQQHHANHDKEVA
jgi:hypothetical protein